MKLELTTILDAPVERVWEELQHPATLAEVSRPMVSFAPDAATPFPERWVDGDYHVTMRLFGVVPGGRQRIRISRPAPYQLHDDGAGTLATTWDHLISVAPLPDGRTRYTDRVEVRAGALTPLTWAFARLFYGHRQRRLRRLARTLR